MGFLDTVKNGAQNLLGNICKATLCIRDSSFVQGKSEKSLSNSFGNMGQKLAGLAKSGARMSDLKSALGGDFAANGFKAYEVQYNPASIRFYTTGEGAGGYTVGANDVGQIAKNISQTRMSFELVFEDISNQDAFDFTSLSLNAETVKDLIKDKVVGKRSVINQVQAFLGVIQNATMQDAIFFWGSNMFRGRLTDVDVHYTMFNKEGNPILARVQMSIQKAESPSDDADRAYWDEAVKKRLGGKNKKSEPYKQDLFSGII